MQDEEIKDMLNFLKTSGSSNVVIKLCVMLEELLKLREKVRKDA